MFEDMLSVFVYPSLPVTTWLAADEKDAIMARLRRDEQDGRLDVDSILPLQRINALPGMVSVFSCTGHKERFMVGGYLTLRVSCEVAEMLDGSLIGRLWEDGLIYHVAKEWQSALDAAGKSVPGVIYTFRFYLGQFEKVCDALCRYTKESTNAVL